MATPLDVGSTNSGFYVWLNDLYGGVKPDFSIAGSQLTGGKAAGRVRVGEGLVHVDGDTITFHNDAGTATYGTLDANGSSFSGNSAIAGNATVGGTLGVTGNTTVGGTMGITGNTTVGGTMGITGNTTVGGSFTGTTGHFTGKLTVDGLLDPTGLVVSEQASVPGGAPAAGNATIWAQNTSPNRLQFSDDAGTTHQIQNGVYELRVGTGCTYTTIEAAISAVGSLTLSATQQCSILVEPGVYAPTATIVLPPYCSLIGLGAGGALTALVSIVTNFAGPMIQTPSADSENLIYGIRFEQHGGSQNCIKHASGNVELRLVNCTFVYAGAFQSTVISIYTKGRTVLLESCYIQGSDYGTNAYNTGLVTFEGDGTAAEIQIKNCKAVATVGGTTAASVIGLRGANQTFYLTDNNFIIYGSATVSAYCIQIAAAGIGFNMSGGLYRAFSANNRNSMLGVNVVTVSPTITCVGVTSVCGAATYSVIFDLGFAGSGGTIYLSGCNFDCQTHELNLVAGSGATAFGNYYSKRLGENITVATETNSALKGIFRATKTDSTLSPYTEGSCEIATDINGEMYLYPSITGSVPTNRVTIPTGKALNFIDTTAAGANAATLINSPNNGAQTGWIPVQVNNATAYLPYFT